MCKCGDMAETTPVVDKPGHENFGVSLESVGMSVTEVNHIHRYL
jgi:hypothetical protein